LVPPASLIDQQWKSSVDLDPDDSLHTTKFGNMQAPYEGLSPNAKDVYSALSCQRDSNLEMTSRVEGLTLQIATIHLKGASAKGAMSEQATVLIENLDRCGSLEVRESTSSSAVVALLVESDRGVAPIRPLHLLARQRLFRGNRELENELLQTRLAAAASQQAD
jgi:hypothetical protein